MSLKLVAVASSVALLLTGPSAMAEDAGGKPFRLELSGAAEVPTNTHGDADRGSVGLTLNQGEGRVCWTFGAITLSAGESLPFMGHIHRAPTGVAGPIVVHLFGSGDAPAAPTAYPTDTVCTHADHALVKEIRKNPDQFYVNLHNTTHPAGVMRAQLDQ